MAEELFPVAQRVLTCFAALPPEEPDPTDVERLRKAVSGEAKEWLPHDLAAYVIKREIKRLQAMRASAA
jgi:hypothetical protein